MKTYNFYGWQMAANAFLTLPASSSAKFTGRKKKNISDIII